jgi:hypothetical protein
MTLPEGALRLFPDGDPAGHSLLFARLLEDGDRHDLAWLASRVPEAELAGWLERHGGRRLSRRSRAFWELVLGRAAAPAPPAGEALWPL